MDNNEFYKINSGQEVLSIGFPLGSNNLKITKGIISGRDNGKIQTTSPLNKGNSGGPMIINDNIIIGINSSGIMNASNVGFAVPISYFNTVYHKNLLNKKKQLIKLPKLGIEKTNLTDDFCKFYNIKSGILVNYVYKDSICEKIGIKIGDIITKINDNIIDNYGLIEKRWYNEKLSIYDYLKTIKLNGLVKLDWFDGKKFKKCKGKFISFDLNLEKKYYLYEKESIKYSISGG